MIYFIKANDRVKIGYADDPKSRIQSIQTSSPFKLEVLLIIDGNFEVESELHDRFQAYRITGEWFEYVDELSSFVKENYKEDRKFEFGFTLNDYANYEQVLRLRKRHNLTLSALGEKLQITAQSAKEMPDREKSGTVSIKVLRNVAEALGYKFEYRFTPMNED